MIVWSDAALSIAVCCAICDIPVRDAREHDLHTVHLLQPALTVLNLTSASILATFLQPSQVGDDPTTHLLDMRTGGIMSSLTAHADYSFGAAWHPGGNLLATGTQLFALILASHLRHPRLVLHGCVPTTEGLEAHECD